MYLLDTNIVSLLFRSAPAYPGLVTRLDQVPAGQLWISAVTVEEVLRGAFNDIRRRETRGLPLADGYKLLTELTQDLARYSVLPFDAQAEARYDAFPAALRRAGAADCKIAAVALQHGCVLVTRNLRHFEAVPGLVCEDWAAA